MNYLIYNPSNKLFWCQDSEDFTGWGHRDTGTVVEKDDLIHWNMFLIVNQCFFVNEAHSIYKNWVDADA